MAWDVSDVTGNRYQSKNGKMYPSYGEAAAADREWENEQKAYQESLKSSKLSNEQAKLNMQQQKAEFAAKQKMRQQAHK